MHTCLLLLALAATAALAQQTSCENDGFPNGTACACPPGFGGSTCSLPGCGGDIFQGLARSLVPQPSNGAAANLSASSCSCEADWTGTGCNVCQTASACQTAFTNAGGANQSTASSVSDGLSGQNDTMTCNTTPTVYASGQMSCQVFVSNSRLGIFTFPANCFEI